MFNTALGVLTRLMPVATLQRSEIVHELWERDSECFKDASIGEQSVCNLLKQQKEEETERWELAHRGTYLS